MRWYMHVSAGYPQHSCTYCQSDYRVLCVHACIHAQVRAFTCMFLCVCAGICMWHICTGNALFKEMMHCHQNTIPQVNEVEGHEEDGYENYYNEIAEAGFVEEEEEGAEEEEEEEEEEEVIQVSRIDFLARRKQIRDMSMKHELGGYLETHSEGLTEKGHKEAQAPSPHVKFALDLDDASARGEGGMKERRLAARLDATGGGGSRQIQIERAGGVGRGASPYVYSGPRAAETAQENDEVRVVHAPDTIARLGSGGIQNDDVVEGVSGVGRISGEQPNQDEKEDEEEEAAYLAEMLHLSLSSSVKGGERTHKRGGAIFRTAECDGESKEVDLGGVIVERGVRGGNGNDWQPDDAGWITCGT